MRTRTLAFATAILILFNSFRQKDITWLAIGDSITYLNDHTDETGNRVTKGYLTGVAEHFTNLHYINKGYNGWTAGNIADKIDSLSLVKADVYSVFLGTNDWWQGRPVGTLTDYKNNSGNATLYGSFRIIINKIKSLNAEAKIVLITPMQRADFVYINDAKNNAFGSYKTKNGQALEAFADAVDSIAGFEKIAVVDLYHNKALGIEKMVNFKRLKNPASGSYTDYVYPQSTPIPYNPATDEYPYPKEAANITYDGLHPSDKGNGIIADLVAEQLTTLGLPLTRNNNFQDKDSSGLQWKAYINLDTYLQPFWATDTITDETVQVLKKGNQTSAALLFAAHKILSVKAANYSKVFTKGKDWNYASGKLTFPAASTVPFLAEDSLYYHEKKANSFDGKAPGSYIYANGGSYFLTKQISVTYIKEKNGIWKGKTPEFAETSLPNTIGKLRNKDSLRIVFYGNSIEVGYGSSALDNSPPFMPAWADMLVYKLRQTYGAPISFVNNSVGGKLARWGIDSVSEKVVAEKPDLIVIGFGMNDGTFKVPPDVYRAEIQGMIDSVQRHNKDAEFILIAPMLANPLSSFDGFQPLYKNELDKLQKKGVVVADITAVHKELLKYKPYQDMTSNNINHPNDYLARWYAQFLCGLLVK